jgi:hypothetical protein
MRTPFYVAASGYSDAIAAFAPVSSNVECVFRIRCAPGNDRVLKRWNYADCTVKCLPRDVPDAKTRARVQGAANLGSELK